MTAITHRLRVFAFGIVVAIMGLIDPETTVKTVVNKLKKF